MFEHVNDTELLDCLRRFLKKIEDYSSNDKCWVWKASKTWNGYGKFSYQSKTWFAHRWSYLLKYGILPDKLQLDHLCKNRACVNPLHLEQVNQSTNLLRGYVYNREKTLCKRGHEFDTANTYYYTASSGTVWRRCKQCKKLRDTHLL